MTGMAGDNEHPVSPSAGIRQAIFSSAILILDFMICIIEYILCISNNIYDEYKIVMGRDSMAIFRGRKIALFSYRIHNLLNFYISYDCCHIYCEF